MKSLHAPFEFGVKTSYNYFSEAHYKKAIDQTFEKEGEQELVPDGGSRAKYYWSGEQGLIYHTESTEFVDPFFNTISEAERFLETQANQNGKEPYNGLVLRRTSKQKMKETTDLLTEQSGLTHW